MNNISKENEYISKHNKYMIQVPGFSPMVITGAKGSIIKDINGKEYIDFISMQSGPASIGNSHPKVIEAAKKQLDKIFCVNSSFINIPKIELAEKLAKITPPKLKKFHFLCGGGEAVEYGLHMAIRITKKQEVISLFYGYHGSSLANLNLGQPWHRRGLPAIPGFKQIAPAYCYRCFFGQEYPNCNLECALNLESMIKLGSSDDVALFLAEPLQGVGGHVIPPKEYFKRIKEICNKYGVLMMFDEIQTGFGRTGKMWASDYYEVEPDIMAVGKAMGGGIPVSAAIFRDDLPIPSAEIQEIVSTFADNPFSCAVASAVIDIVLEEDLANKAATMGIFIYDRLYEMKEKHKLIGDVRSLGMFNAIELVKDRKTKEKAIEEASEVALKCRNKGLIVAISNKPKVGNVIKFTPPLNINKELVLKGLEILDESLYEVENSK